MMECMKSMAKKSQDEPVEMENERKFWENAYNRNLGKEKARSYEHAIEIVKGGGVNGD